MLSVADSALDLLVLELVLHSVGVGVLALVLLVLAPVGRGAEDDVLADRGCVRCRARAVLGRQAKLLPLLALGHARVHHLAVRRQPHPARRLDLLALVVEAPADDGLGAVLVDDGLGVGQPLGGSVIDVVVVGPCPVEGGMICFG